MKALTVDEKNALTLDLAEILFPDRSVELEADDEIVVEGLGKALGRYDAGEFDDSFEPFYRSRDFDLVARLVGITTLTAHRISAEKTAIEIPYPPIRDTFGAMVQKVGSPFFGFASGGSLTDAAVSAILAFLNQGLTEDEKASMKVAFVEKLKNERNREK